MKKIYLLAIALLSFVFINAQVWNFGEDTETFPINAGIGDDGSATINGLYIHGTNSNMGQVDKNNKSFTSPTTEEEYSFLNRFKFNGGGYSGSKNTDEVPTTMLPTQRYISLEVEGNATIYVIGITGSNNNERRLFVTDGADLIGNMVFGGSDLVEHYVEYEGAATTLYIYGNAAINLYYLSATEKGTGVGIQNAEYSPVVSTEYYNLSGVYEGADFNALANGLYIKVSVLENGNKTSEKVLKK